MLGWGGVCNYNPVADRLSRHCKDVVMSTEYRGKIQGGGEELCGGVRLWLGEEKDFIFSSHL